MRNRPRCLAPRLMAAAVLTGFLAARTVADDAQVLAAPDLGAAGGAEIFAHICQGCHMPGAQGASGAGRYPKLAGDPALVSWEYVALTVLQGKNGMPAFGLKPTGDLLDFLLVNLSDDQVASVVNYVRTNFGNHYKGTVTAQQVAALPHPGGAAELTRHK